MKTLIIHPEDKSTNFLKSIYASVPDKTVLTEGDKVLVSEMVKSHQRIIMMGHGSPNGLFSVGKFDGTGGYVIDVDIVPLLRDKTNIFIWCNADQFVLKHGLNGFYSGMFVSEVGEALFCKLTECYDLERLVKESNDGFSRILSEVIESPVDNMHKHVIEKYSEIAKNNKVANYNLERLYKRS